VELTVTRIWLWAACQFCILCQNTDSWLFKVANVMFPLTFLLVRLCMGIPFSYIWGQKLWVLLQTGNPSAVLAGKSYVLYGAVCALCVVC
jgi:hypothetical protein